MRISRFLLTFLACSPLTCPCIFHSTAHVFYDLRPFEVDTANPSIGKHCTACCALHCADFWAGQFNTSDASFRSLLRVACLCNNCECESRKSNVSMSIFFVCFAFALRVLSEFFSNTVLLAFCAGSTDGKRVLKGDASEQGITRFIEPHFQSRFQEVCFFLRFGH